MKSDWIEIIELSPLKQAKKALAVWLELQKKQGVTISDDDVRQDIVRASDGTTKTRYVVRCQSKSADE